VWRRKFSKRLSNKLTSNTSEATADVSDREAVIWLLLILAMIVLVYQNCPDDVLKVIVSLYPAFYYLLNDLITARLSVIFTFSSAATT
jgi:hypothetical protein